jgi:hypothetical protein
MFDAVWPILCPAGEQGGEQLGTDSRRWTQMERGQAEDDQ